MKNISTATPPISRPIDLIPQIIAAIIGGVIIFSLLLVAVLIGYNISFAGKIYPGVAVAGVDLSGTEPAEAALLLETRLDFPKQGKILFRDGEKIWLASPSQVGFYLNPQASATMAYQYGRTGGPLNRLSDQFKSWYLGTALPPMYVFDENTAQMYIAGIAAQTDSQKVEGSLSIEGVEVVVQPSQTGRQLNIPATLESLQLQLETMQDGEIRLKIEEDSPVILNVEEQAQIARQILSQPLILTVPDPLEHDPGSWTFESDFLAQLITIEQVNEPAGERYQVGLETDGLTSFL
ncbi:MAG TPA: peptidoglycan binding domain-containing protein, partial [Anaerolineales bacterium]|nr:peptidoglycan binding domain-containing protein [Anaerolineales bacterium]